MALYKDLKELEEELEYWNNYEPVNNMGKWYRSIRVLKLERKMKQIEKELNRNKKL